MTQQPKGESAALGQRRGGAAARARKPLRALGAPVPGRGRRDAASRRRRGEDGVQIAERRARRRIEAARDGPRNRHRPRGLTMARPKILTAADAARLIPDGAIVTVSSSSALGCPDAVLAAIGARFDARGPSAQPDDAAPDRRRRHVGRQGHRPHRQARLPGEGARRLLPLRPLLRRAAGDLEDDRRRRDPRLQRALGHPVRHASRGRGQAPRRADQGRHGHLRRSRRARAAR